VERCSSLTSNSQLLTNVDEMRPRIPIAVLVAVLATASCGSDSAARDDGAPADITVFAAASLTAAFTELGDAFMVANPGAEVTFSFAGSSELVAQLREGAPADVFASADLATMAQLTGADLVEGEPEVFATNVAEIIVEAGNPRGITGVADLANDDLVVVQCAPAVPCGAYAEQVVANAGVTVTPSSLEQSVKAVATKVVLGEADAGIVYRTDVLAAGDDADGVAIPDDVNVVARYPIALVADTPDPLGGRAFIDFVRSAAGQQILADEGFGPS
jgi:molybdate transport system substrate-binding protein